MIKLAIQQALIHFMWSVAWSGIQPSNTFRVFANRKYNEHEDRLAVFMAKQCFKSGWWGYNVTIKGKDYIVSTKEAHMKGSQHEN